MASREKVRRGVRNARNLLRQHGYHVRTRTKDLVLWFKAESPFDSGGLNEVLAEPLLVVHELVEIELVKMMGLRLTKKVIVNNLRVVDRAHLEAAKTELTIAANIGAVEHIRSRIPDIESWISDASVSKEHRAEYRKLLARARKSLARMDLKDEA